MRVAATATLLSASRSLLDTLPIARWAPLYDWRACLASDVTSALGVLVIGVPEAIAFASIAGLPPASGLYSILVAPAMYGLLGSSPYIAIGPTSIVSILTGSALPDSWGGAPLLPETPLAASVASLLALLVALILALLTILALGSVVRRFVSSTPLLSGFVSALALVVGSTQLSPLLGLPRCANADGSACTFVDAVVSIFSSASTLRAATPTAACISLALLLTWKLALPRVLPPRFAAVGSLAPLVLMLVAISVTAAVGIELLEGQWGLRLVEAIPAGLPSGGVGGFPPSTTATDFGALFQAAVPVSIIALVELVAVGASAAAKGGSGMPDVNSELVALIVTNGAVGLARGYPVTSSVSRTAVAMDMRARSPVASLISGLLVIPILLWATPALSLLPRVATAAMVMTVLHRLVKFAHFRSLLRTDWRDATVWLVVFIATLTAEPLTGFLLGVGASWVVALSRADARATVRVFSRADGGALIDWGAAEERSIMLQPPVVHVTHNPLYVSPASASSISGGGADWGETRAEAHPHDTAHQHTLLPHKTCAVIVLAPGSGDLQFASASAFVEALHEAVACYSPATAIILDLTRVRAIDTSAAQALLDAINNMLPHASGGCRYVFAANVASTVTLLLKRVAAEAERERGGMSHTAWAPSVEEGLASLGGGAEEATAPPPPPSDAFTVPPSAREGQRIFMRRAREPFCESAAAGEAEAAMPVLQQLWRVMLCGRDTTPLLRHDRL